MSVSQVAIDACSHYMGKGIARGPAIGIISCLMYESNLNPGSQGVQGTETPGALNPSGAWGVASWNGPRQAALDAFAKGKGIDLRTADTTAARNIELDFVLTESANSYPKVWAAIQSGAAYADFIPIFVADYENPADHQKEINAAMAVAHVLDPIVPQSVVSQPAPKPSPAPAPGPVPATSPAPQGSIAMNPILAALLDAFATALVRAIMAEFVNSVAAGTIVAPAPLVPAAPIQIQAAPTSVAVPLDLGSLANVLTPIISGVLSSTLPGLVAAELVKVGQKP